jgi:hypothetical protein
MSRCAVIFRKLSPLSARRWALWTSHAEDGVGDGRVSDDLVPTFDRHLAGDDSRSALVAIIDDSEETPVAASVVTFLDVCRRSELATRPPQLSTVVVRKPFSMDR